MPISWLDVILIAIMLISGFLAMVRGFTREVLSIFSWAMAAIAALYLTPKYASMLQPYVGNPSIAQIAFAAGVFILTLIVVSLILGVAAAALFLLGAPGGLVYWAPTGWGRSWERGPGAVYSAITHQG